MTFRSTTALAALGAMIPLTGFAAETAAPAAAPAPTVAPVAAPAAVPAEAPALVEGKLEIKPYAFLENYMILNRTGTTKAPGFESGRTYFGLKARNGMARATLETALTGPYRYRSHSHGTEEVTNTDNEPTEVAAASTDKNDVFDGFLGIRKAEVYLALPTDTEIHLGRVRPSGADMWGADAIGWFCGAQGFGSVDGLMLRQRLTVDDMKFSAGLTYANTLVSRSANRKTKGYTPYEYLGDSNQAWSKGDRAIVANVGAEAFGLEMRLYYGMEKNQIVNNLGDNKVWVVDYSQIEASLGYNVIVNQKGDKLVTVGGWYERDADGKMTEATMKDNGSGSIKTGKTLQKAVVTTRYGVGVVADGEAFGASNLLQKDDTILLGVSWESNDKGLRDGAKGKEKTKEEDSATQIYTASVGYKAGGLETYLGLKSENTAGKVQSGQDGKDVKAINTTYMKMAWWFE